jgi:hypothetical protein
MAATCFGLSKARLEEGLIHRVSITRNESISIPLNVAQVCQILGLIADNLIKGYRFEGCSCESFIQLAFRLDRSEIEWENFIGIQSENHWNFGYIWV